MKYVWAAASHKGMIRENNEDSMFPSAAGESDGPAILMVADGMGGHVAGEVASRLAVNAASSAEVDDPGDRVAFANRAIREEVARQPDLDGMGTTLTLVELRPDATARIGHVGDSRAYAYSVGELVQLTEDHTVAAEMVNLGELTPENALNHPQSHMLTRCLGLTRFVNVDETTLDLEVGDRLLLCSDGLSSMVKDKRIAEILGTESLEDTVWKLIDEANGAGGVDNITVIVIEVVE